jgi:hypothetical protein
VLEFALLMPRIEEMMLCWQSWMPEQTAFIRFFESSALPAAFPEFPEVSGLAPGMQAWVICNVVDGLPMKLRGTLEVALADAAANSFVVVSIEWGDSPSREDRL